MSKRFTATTKWEDSWFQDLRPSLKCAWIYMLDRCDNAGVWDVNTRVLSFLVGETISWESLRDSFGDRLVEFQPGKVWIRKFIEFQYGELSLSCKPHQNVIGLLRRYGLWEIYAHTPQRVSEGYKQGTQRDKEEEEDKDKDQDQDLGKGSAEGKPPDPWPSLPVTSSEAVAHAAYRRANRPGPAQGEFDRALRVLEAYPIRAKKDGRIIKKDLAAQNVLAFKIFETPAFPWEEAAALEGEGQTPQDLGAWVAKMPDPILLASLRAAMATPVEPKPGARPEPKKSKALA